MLNYCDALTALSELSRVLKPNGNLILEYESSWGFEYLHKNCYKKDAYIITTEYIEKEHSQWLYSPKYIKNILKTCNFNIIENYPFHISDGLFSKILDDRTAINYVKIDKLLYKFPFFKEHGNNIILHCIKDLYNFFLAINSVVRDVITALIIAPIIVLIDDIDKFKSFKASL